MILQMECQKPFLVLKQLLFEIQMTKFGPSVDDTNSFNMTKASYIFPYKDYQVNQNIYVQGNF